MNYQCSYWKSSRGQVLKFGQLKEGRTTETHDAENQKILIVLIDEFLEWSASMILTIRIISKVKLNPRRYSILDS